MALGRGLSSLIQPKAINDTQKEQVKADIEGRHETIFYIPTERIEPNPFQPRKHFDEEALKELASSVKEDGILQPIIVSQAQGVQGKPTYQIVAGERRWRAAKLVGLKEVPAIVKNIGENREGLRIAILENIQRENLNAIELAEGYKRLSEEFGMRQEDIAARVGKSRQTVGNTIRLLSLPKQIRDDIVAGAISENHARAMLALASDELRLRLWREVREQKLSARQTEVAARRYKKVPSKSAASLDAMAKDAMVRLEARLGTKVTVEPGPHVSDGGKIVIKYFSNEDLKNIVKKITDNS
ncbi:ParB/RepB/Spo0J family partition protein [Candidatus Azambacteria bacterium]|nr:ParB/RepB/Spo0J family partition protein [Candidatus Azambacteria bacterium]